MPSEEWRFPRLARALRRLRSLWLLPAALLVGYALWALPGEVRNGSLTHVLDERGRHATATVVELRSEDPAFDRSSVHEFVEARVRFEVADGPQVTATLAGFSGSTTLEPDGWHPADEDSGYQAPLEVVYDPDQPTSVMAAKDIESYSDLSGSVAFLGVFAALGLVCAGIGIHRTRPSVDSP